VLGGLVVSTIVLLLQVVLQPGKPVRDGVARPAQASIAVVLAIAKADAEASPGPMGPHHPGEASAAHPWR
jgi:hypothetical protein